MLSLLRPLMACMPRKGFVAIEHIILIGFAIAIAIFILIFAFDRLGGIE